MAGFSEQLRAEAEPIWEAIFRHPFLREIKDGTLPLETFQYYLGQDYHYLEGFGRAVAMTLAKSPDSDLLKELAHRVMTPVERPLHHVLIEAAGLTMEEVEGATRSPTNTAYVNHMLVTAAMLRAGSDGGGVATVSMDVPSAEGRSGAVGAPAVRAMDAVLRRRVPAIERGRVDGLRGRDGRAGWGPGEGGDAVRVHGEQPVRVHVLGSCLPARGMGGLGLEVSCEHRVAKRETTKG